MSSSPTTSNRLNKQGTGDGSGTWGAVLNQAVFDLVDESLDGVISIPLGPNIILTSTNYASDQARHRVLKFTGTGGIATIPGVPKWYLVHNTCSGSATLKTAGGIGAAVPAGAILPVYCDATDCFLATNLFPLADGTAAAPGLYFSADSDSGFYRIGANDIGISVGGAQVLAIASAGITVTGAITANGGLFGTTLTASGAATVGSLTVTGPLFGTAVTASGAATVGSLTVTGPLFGTAVTASGAATVGSLFATGAVTGGSLVTGGTLSVTGAASITGTLATNNNVTTILNTNGPVTNYISNANAGAAAEAFFGASNGTVTTNGPGGPRLGHRGTAQTGYGALVANAAYLYANASPLVLMADSPSGMLQFAAGGNVETARAAVTGSNAVWRVGFSSYNFNTAVGALSIGYAGDGTQYGIVMRPQSDNTRAMDFQNVLGTTIGSISQDATTTTYNTTSDYRLKSEIVDLTGSGAFIDALRPRVWVWRETGLPGAGFIAHEAQAVSPSSVNGARDAVDAEGRSVYQGMQPGSAEIIANLVAELQALRARIAVLEAR